jgi:hypothetical protein
MDLVREKGPAGKPRQKPFLIGIFLVKRPRPEAGDVDGAMRNSLISIGSCCISPSYCVGVKSISDCGLCVLGVLVDG